jgi:pyrroloquinoline quinone biosynthesis protein B
MKLENRKNRKHEKKNMMRAESGATSEMICGPHNTGSFMEVLLLGAAQDGGFPQFGCWCDNCHSAYRGELSADTAVSLAIIDRESKNWWLVEAAPQLGQQWASFAGHLEGLSLAGVFLTHAHAGHYPGLIYLGKEALNAQAVPLFASAAMHDFLQLNEPWAVLYRNGNVTRRDLLLGAPLRVSDRLTVIATPVTHRPDFTDTVSFTFEGPTRSLFFCPDIDDWSGLSEPLLDIVRRVDVALLDATFYDDNELPGRDMSKIPHPRVIDTEAIIGREKIKAEVFLIHINHSNKLWSNTAEVLRLASVGLLIGRKGHTWTL